jgi:type IV pilus assembly protein PilO
VVLCWILTNNNGDEMAFLPDGFDINDLELSEIGTWPALIKTVAIAVVCLIAFGAGYWFKIQAQYDAYDRVLQAQVELKIEFEKKQGKALNLPLYLEQKKIVEEKLFEVVQLLPAETEVPSLVEDVSQQGIEAGLNFRSIRMRPDRVQDFYIELPMEINVVGDYHDLAEFTSLIATLPRLVTMHDFTLIRLSSNEKRGFSQYSADNLLRMILTAKTYRYIEEDEQ